MRLKEIKPGMAIYCDNEKDAKELWMWFFSNGYVREREYEDILENFIKCVPCYFSISKNGKTWTTPVISKVKHMEIVKFSDLIIPELTAEELLKIIGEIKIHCMEDRLMCGDCRLNRNNNKSGVNLCDFKNLVGNEKLLIEICEKWKSEHEKKEPKIETVDICRIIEVLPDRKSVVYEENLNGAYGSTKEEEAQEILKKYIEEHEGNYIAVIEHVFMVKE